MHRDHKPLSCGTKEALIVKKVYLFWFLVCFVGVGSVPDISQKGFCQNLSNTSPPNELIMRFVGGEVSRPQEVLRGEPVRLILGMWNQTMVKVKGAEEQLKRIQEEVERKQLNDAQMALRLSQPDAVAAIRAASVKVAPIDLGTNWCRRMRFTVERIVGSGKQMKKIPVFVDLDWRRYLSEEEQRQQVFSETFRPQWYVGPEFTQKLDPGEYHVRAMLGEWESEPFAMTVKPLQSDMERAHLYIVLSDYYLERKKDFARAAEYAKIAISLEEPVGSHASLGKVYKAQGQWQNALNEYEKELQVVYKKDPRASAEPPQGLFFEIEWLKQKLAKQRAAPSQKSRRR
jgi:tetratricopeptide (TPR) repeat protein